MFIQPSRSIAARFPGEAGTLARETAASSGVTDSLVATGWALLGASLSWWASAQFAHSFYQMEWINIWFQADQPRVLGNMLDMRGSHRSSVHPIFSILMVPLTNLLLLLGLTPVAAAKALVAGAGGLSAALFYLSMRGLTLSLPIASLLTAGLLASATYLYWFAIVETYPFAALGTSIMLWAVTSWRNRGMLPWALASAATLAITTTNWSFGLAAAFFRLGLRRSIAVSLLAFAMIAGLAVVQRVTFEDAGVFFQPRVLKQESEFLRAERSEFSKAEEARGETPLSVLRSILLYSAVTAHVRVEPVQDGILESVMVRRPDAGASQDWFYQYVKAHVPFIEERVYNILNNQHSPVLDQGWAGLGGMLAWIVLLACGVWGAILHRPGRAAAMAIGAFLLGQIALHLVYGEITFLYAADFFPALLALAAFAFFTPARRLAVVAALAFVILGGISNVTELRSNIAEANSIMQKPLNPVLHGNKH
ncbi:hypothetical protein RQ831_13055 [Roseomonas gilardii]|uniref:Uncharacterized protein n=1 Tax=Roseomonas gilardii TaxID=257708 RepID=A0ABU3MG89_9PROT|nr:hypothetical protein [Roseomonas gilardii]MDT8331984.1 hypothetical protein [Roseomonas gilardii]